MREIKFRAWGMKEKRMYLNVEQAYDSLHCHNYPDSLKKDEFENCGCDVFSHNFGPCCFGQVLDDKNYKVMQFTGLKDKNGKEIYEGDIIKCEDLYCDVKWDEFECGFIFDSDGRSICVRPEFSKQHWEIIGNIYENPKLLK